MQPIQSDFVRISQQMIQARLAATTPDAKRLAAEELAHLLRMFGSGRFDEWRATHPEYDGVEIDDSMGANAEWL